MSLALFFTALAFSDHQEKTAAAVYLSSVEGSLKKNLTKKLNFLFSLEKLLFSDNDAKSVSHEANKELLKSNFSLFTQSLSAAYPEIESIELAPDGILQYSSDSKGISMVESDLLKDESHRKTIIESIQQKQPVLRQINAQGQEDPRIIATFAVLSTKAHFDTERWKQNGRFTDDSDWMNEIPPTYWGSISVIIDTRKLLDECITDDHFKTFNLSIQSLGPSDMPASILFGGEESYKKAIQTLNFEYSGLKWSFAVSRTDSSKYFLSGSALILGLILSAAAFTQFSLINKCNSHLNLIAENVNANQAKTQFLATMSHELRTPIHSIMVYAESLVENIYGPISEPQLKVVEHMQKASEHLLELVNDILDINKIESNQLTLELAKHSVNRTCNESIEMVQNQVREKKLDLEFNGDPRIPEFSYDSRRIKQVLINLLYNAIKFTPEGGRILVETEFQVKNSGSPICQITVKDSGIGISEEDQKELFQPFKQVDNSLVRKSNGVGLGLYISKSIIELHDGKISIQSAKMQGSSFIIDLPIVLEGEAEAENSDFRI